VRLTPIAGLGVLVILFGGLVATDPALAGALDLGTVALTIVGGVATVQGLRFVALGLRDRPEAVDLGDPEVAKSGAALGGEYDATFDDGDGRRSGGTAAEVDSLRERFRRVAVDRLAVARDWDADRAEAALDDGAWTDDPVAAAFLSGERIPVRDRLRSYLRRKPPYRFALERTVAAIADLEGTE